MFIFINNELTTLYDLCRFIIFIWQLLLYPLHSVKDVQWWLADMHILLVSTFSSNLPIFRVQCQSFRLLQIFIHYDIMYRIVRVCWFHGNPLQQRIAPI